MSVLAWVAVVAAVWCALSALATAGWVRFRRAARQHRMGYPPHHDR